MTIRGSCLCNGVQYEVHGELKDIANCHCSVCRRTLGAAFGTYARVDVGEFQWLSGEDLVTSYESSPGVCRCFCRQCGSTLGAMDEGGKLSWVTLGSVSGDPGVRPEAHIFVGSKAPWIMPLHSIFPSGLLQPGSTLLRFGTLQPLKP